RSLTLESRALASVSTNWLSSRSASGAKLIAEHVEGPAEIVAGEKAEQPHVQGVRAFPFWLFAELRRAKGLRSLNYSRRSGFTRHPLGGSASLFTPPSPSR